MYKRQGRYDDTLSRELTEKTKTANLRLRELGFPVADLYRTSSSIDEVLGFIEEIGGKRGEFSFPIDLSLIHI